MGKSLVPSPEGTVLDGSRDGERNNDSTVALYSGRRANCSAGPSMTRSDDAATRPFEEKILGESDFASVLCRTGSAGLAHSADSPCPA
jgi:hypothetical protein